MINHWHYAKEWIVDLRGQYRRELDQQGQHASGLNMSEYVRSRVMAGDAIRIFGGMLLPYSQRDRQMIVDAAKRIVKAGDSGHEIYT